MYCVLSYENCNAGQVSVLFKGRQSEGRIQDIPSTLSRVEIKQKSKQQVG